MLEDLETEALMREWGSNKNYFRHSPPRSSDGFESPIDMPFEDPQQLPPLAEIFNAVPSFVVVPAEMDYGVTSIVQGLASIGIEKLLLQAKKLCFLEDIIGKTMQHIAWKLHPACDWPERFIVTISAFPYVFIYEYEDADGLLGISQALDERTMLDSSEIDYYLITDFIVA
ncbi:unnamed protein product [Fraxinus pennsylvanica]|uniref:PMI1/PMIR1-2 C-terminal domain-containing protein n=1 Tax=Fraxinus pennsylvanica TaxID=56036 RepID=A0AAD2A8D1_9LAMI|nr:unnamed protein product [Fraxinus pennsylvanica]